jgi:hypothetical protein
MSSSFWLLGVESRDFSQAEKERTACKAEQIHNAGTYLQLPLREWGAGKVYLLVLSSWKVNIAKNPIAVMGL